MALRADLPFMTAEVVEDDHLAFGQAGRQHFLDIEREELTVGGTVENPGGADRGRYMILETVAPSGDDPAVSFPAIAS